MTLADGRHDMLARLATLVVGGGGQLVLHHGVQQYQLVAYRVEGVVFVLQRAAIEADQAARLPEDGGELVHDTAVHADIIVLGGLPDFRQLELVDTEVEQLVQGERVGALQRGGGGHARPEGHVAREYGVEAAWLAAALAYLAAYAEDVARPAGRGGFLLGQPELGVIVEVECEGAYLVRPVGLDFRDHALVHGAGEDEAAVVVRVLANQVDTAGRGVKDALAMKQLVEFLFDFLFHHIFVV